MGAEYVIHHPDDLLVYEYDGSVDRNVPQAVVLPNSTEEVSRVMALAYRDGIPVAGRGSGTGLSGGAIAPEGGIQIAFTRMHHILEVDTENCTATVQPGVINLDLDTYAHRFGFRYAPDPSSQRACSLGGNIAENAGGPHCLAYGSTTNHVLGMEVVLEDGSVVNLGSAARETPGYDLRGVFTGSEGTFGVATKIMVRLLPVPEAVKTFLGVYPDVDSAATAVSAVIGHGIVPAALEMIDGLSIRAVQNVMDAGYPEDAGAVLLVELEGLQEEVDEIGAEVEAALWESGPSLVRVAEEADDRANLWIGRKGVLGALGSSGAELLLGGRCGAPDTADPSAAAGEPDKRRVWRADRQRAARGGRQPASLLVVRRTAAGGDGKDNRSGCGGNEGLHRGRGRAYR